MIKKIIPLLLLIYVALMPGTRASAPGGVADQTLYPGEKLIAFDTIVLKTPKVLIADPFNGVVELYVRTATPIWGTSNFDDNFIHVSANYSYQWTVGDILSYDPPSRRYDCQSTIPYLLEDTLNNIHFHASYIESTVTYDTVANFEIRYAKPVVTVLAINDDPYAYNTMVVNSPTDVRIDVNLNRAYDLIDPEGYDKVIALDAKLNDGSWEQVWDDPEGTRDLNWQVLLTDFAESLQPGYNTLYFRSEGKHSGIGDEYSEIVSVTIFYLDYVAIGPKVCRDDQVTELIGIPEGGYFTGNGIIDETALFDPSGTTEGIHTLTYNYLLEGTVHTVPKTVEVVALPDFTLTGDLEVCYNDWDIHYSINSLTGTYDAISWDEIQGGEIILISGDNSLATIHWHGEGTGGSEIHTGKITVTMEKNNCSVTKEFLVDIGKTMAPDPSFMMLYNNNLLVCDDVSATYFEWYHNNVLKFTTDEPYCFLGDAFSPNNGDEFFVLTASDLCDTNCLTRSNVYIYNPGGKLAVANNELPVYPNPGKGDFTVLLPGVEDHDYVLTASTLTGQVIASIPVNPSVVGMEYKLDANDWPAGIYLLRLDGYSTSLYKKIMITQ